MIAVKDLSKEYGNRVVLDQIGLSFEKGKITSLIGPNGAGKSTLLSVISRLIPQDKGMILLDEQEINKFDSRQLARQLSILKQANHFDLRLTVKELVSFGRFPYSQGRLNQKDEEKVQEALHYMSLEAIQDAYLNELSGGQKQRAFLAMVVAQDTDYILLDEPLNNLDMKHSVQIMKTLRKLSSETGKTIIIVIHDINFAACYSDYIAALKNGSLLYHNTVDKVITEQILEELFEIPFSITEIGGYKISNYFNI